MPLQPACLASAVHVSPPGSSRASTDLLLTSFHLSSSKTGKNNLLPAVDMRTLLLQVRKQLPPPDAFKGFIACGADAACTGPVTCAMVSVSVVLLFVPGSVLQLQVPFWGTAGRSCSIPVLSLGSTLMGDMGGAGTRCATLVAEERQRLLLTRGEALRESCHEDWGERPGPSQLKTHSAVGKW